MAAICRTFVPADGTSGAAWRKVKLREVPDLWQLSDNPVLIFVCMWGAGRQAQGGIANSNAALDLDARASEFITSYSPLFAPFDLISVRSLPSV
jgi:hypothetical protein